MRIEGNGGRIMAVRNLWVCVLVMLFATGVASANTPATETRSELSSPERIGSAELDWFGIKLYKAELFTETGGAFAWGSPFRLDLTYSRDFSTSALVKATLIELDRLEGPRADHPEIGVELGRCFEDVRRGHVFSAIALERNAIRFLLNGEETCTLQHEDIRSRFLGIWLSDQSRELAASKALRGLN
jgi:hypothetical protein